MAQGAAAAKGDGTVCGGQGGDNGTGQCSMGKRGLLGSRSTAGAARTTRLYFQETIQHPACSSPTSGRVEAWREPCSLWECTEGSPPCPPEQLLLQNQQLMPSAPLGTLCSPQVTVLGSGPSPTLLPLKLCHLSLCSRGASKEVRPGMGIPQSIPETPGGAAKAWRADGDRK